MTRTEIITKIEALTEWETIIEEAKAEAELIKDDSFPFVEEFEFCEHFVFRHFSYLLCF